MRVGWIITILLSTFLLLGFSSQVSAQKSPAFENSNVPEQNGDYPDPDHPGVRVRVFVHDANEHKGPPGSTSSSLVCSTDPNSDALVAAAGWHLSSGNWTYNLNLSSVPDSVGSSNLPTVAANGFGAWQNALVSSSSKPNLVRGGDTTVDKSFYDGLNIITWGRTSGTALGVTYIRYYTSSGLVVDVDSILNKKFPWSWSGGSLCASSDTYDAQNILTHEQGHWYGLDDEYTTNYVNNTMYGYGGKGETKKDTLTSGDKNGVLAIY